MISADFSSELVSLTPSSLIELFVLDLTNIISDLPEQEAKFYFYNGTNYNYQNLIWQGQSYIGLPIEAEGFSVNTQSPPRPKIRIVNFEGSFSRLIKAYGGIEGARVYRKRTLVKYLDAENFHGNQNPHGDPDPNEGFEDDIYIVEQKTVDSGFILEYELSSPIDLEEQRFPTSQVLAKICRHNYRGDGSYGCGGCRYSGPIITDDNDKIVGKITGFFPWGPEKTFNQGDFVVRFNGITSRYFEVTGVSSKNEDPLLFDQNWKEFRYSGWSENVNYASGDISFVRRQEKGFFEFYHCKRDHTSSLPYSGVKNMFLWHQDRCAKTIPACRKRFYSILPMGNFAGTATLPYTL